MRRGSGHRCAAEAVAHVVTVFRASVIEFLERQAPTDETAPASALCPAGPNSLSPGVHHRQRRHRHTIVTPAAGNRRAQAIPTPQWVKSRSSRDCGQSSTACPDGFGGRLSFWSPGRSRQWRGWGRLGSGLDPRDGRLALGLGLREHRLTWALAAGLSRNRLTWALAFGLSPSECRLQTGRRRRASRAGDQIRRSCAASPQVPAPRRSGSSRATCGAPMATIRHSQGALLRRSCGIS